MTAMTQFDSLYAAPSRNGIYKSKEFHGSGCKIVNMGELFAYPFLGNQEMKRLQVKTSELERFGLADGDLLFARRSLVESGAGKCVLVVEHDEPLVFESSLIRVRLDRNRALPRYYYYYFSSPVGRARITPIITGAAQKGIRGTELAKVRVHSPPLSTQRRIAGILSAYDDLIENNTKRIKILEEMARALYREWFVHFRFPGHEKVKLIDSPLGQIPEGWEAVPVSSIAETHRGRSYRKVNLLEEGGHPFLNLKNVARDGGFRRDGTKRYEGPFKEHQTARPGHIIVAVTDMTQERRIVARAARVPELGAEFAVCSMDLVRVAPNDGIDPEYLYSFLRYSGFPDNVKNHAHGTNVLHLNPDRIRDFESCHPGAELQAAYGRTVGPMRRLADVLGQKNDRLRETRDLLLPRLISGAIDVEALELPEVAE
jgi:type I restriction enzyme S subunit